MSNSSSEPQILSVKAEPTIYSNNSTTSIKNEPPEELISSRSATTLTNVRKTEATVLSNQSVTVLAPSVDKVNSSRPSTVAAVTKPLNAVSILNSPISKVQTIAAQAKLSNPITVAKVSNMENKKFVKCIDKNGKVSLVQIIADPNNPKILRLVSNGVPLTPASASSIMANAKGLTGLNTATSITQPRIITLPKQILLPKTNTSTVKIVSIANALAQGLLVRPIASTPSTPPMSVNVLSTLQMASIQSPSASQRSLISQQSALIKPPISLNGPAVIRNNSATALNCNHSNAIKFTKPQQSLLKPQISLLKAVNADKTKLPLQAIVDNRNLKMVTVENIKGLLNKKINVFIKQEPSRDRSPAVETSAKKIYTKPKRQYAEKLEQLFFANHFTNICGAVNWLLRRIPLITSLALAPQYRESFPFVVESEQKFNKLFVAKQRSFEVSYFQFHFIY